MNDWRRMGTALLAIAVAGCAGPELEAADEDVTLLRAFLSAQTAAPPSAGDAEELGRTLVRQSVRAFGYAKSDVEDPGLDGWSPVVRRGAAEPEAGDVPADLSPWLRGGDVDADGRFVPCAMPCPVVPPPEGEPSGAEQLDDLGDRIARLAGAAARLAGGDVTLAWAEPSEEGMVLEPGTVHLNPRLLHLVPPVRAARSAEDPGASPPGPAPQSSDDGEPPAAPVASNGLDNHPRPEESRSGKSGGADNPCDDACDDAFNDLFDCDSPNTSSSSSSSSCKCGLVGAAGPEGAGALLLAGSALVGLVARRRRRRGRATRAWLALCLVLALAPSARAQTEPWKERYESGVRLLHEKRYAAAIDELRKSQELHAAPETLLKLAQAYRGAGRQPRAIEVLEAAIADFGPKLTAAQRAQASRDIDAMRAELAYVTVHVEPEAATLLVDGDAILPGAVSKLVPVAPGKHVIGARLDGFAPAEERIDVKPGSKDAVVTLKLVADKGFVVVTAPAPHFLIALDGTPMGKGAWKGFVAPGAHAVQVYAPGGQAYSFPVDVTAGKMVEVPPSGGAPAGYGAGPAGYGGVPEPAAAPDGPVAPAPRPRPPVKGGYAIAGATLVWPSGRPYGFVHAGFPAPGFAVGGRFGYRAATPIALEVLVEYQRIGQGGSVVQTKDADTNGDGVVSQGEQMTDDGDAAYLRQSFHLAPALKLMSSGKRFRVAGALALGAAFDGIGLDHQNLVPSGNTWTRSGTYHHDFTGWSFLGQLELGLEFQASSMVIGPALVASLQNTGWIHGDPFISEIEADVGIGIRGGYTAW